MATTSADNDSYLTPAFFDAVTATYDDLRFLQRCASRLIQHAGLQEGANVLHIGMGTCLGTIAAAHGIGPAGRVTGVEICPSMLDCARKRCAEADMRHVEFQAGGSDQLNFPEGAFDSVLCASSLEYFPDPQAALREWQRVLVPGGQAGFSSFGKAFLHPLRDLWIDRLRQHGITLAMSPVHPLHDPDRCVWLLHDAGFTEIEVHTEQLGYYLRSGEERWHDIAIGLEGVPLLELSADERAQIRAEHLAELEAFTTCLGIWVDVSTNFVFGRTRHLQ